MILKSWFGTLADSTPFTDIPLNVHWHGLELFDEDYRVGRVDQIWSRWAACPYWNEQEQQFDTQEEAKAWLLAMYKMGGANEPKTKRRVRPAAK